MRKGQHDGWTLKAGVDLDIWFVRRTRKEVIKQFEELMNESWKKHQRCGFNKIVKVKLVEINESN